MIIGLTGGIAAGKSTVFQAMATARPDLATFDADSCVHELLADNPHVAEQVGTLLGSEVLGPGGKPCRTKLRDLVFGNAEARRTLESILHPLVRSEWMSQRNHCQATGRDFIADIPLLYETEAESFFDAVIVVACSEAVQLRRLAGRKLPARTSEAILASQLPMGQKVGRASFVIWNDGTMAALRRQTELLINQLFAA